MLCPTARVLRDPHGPGSGGWGRSVGPRRRGTRRRWWSWGPAARNPCDRLGGRPRAPRPALQTTALLPPKIAKESPGAIHGPASLTAGFPSFFCGLFCKESDRSVFAYSGVRSGPLPCTNAHALAVFRFTGTSAILSSFFPPPQGPVPPGVWLAHIYSRNRNVDLK